MFLTEKQLQTLKQHFQNVESDSDLSQTNPQLRRLALNFFTWFIGIDVCKDGFDVVIKDAFAQVLHKGQFDNHHDGFVQFFDWLSMLNGDANYQLLVAIECTGPYHQGLVRFLQQKEISVSLYNGQTAKHLAKAHLQEKKTDKLDATMLANLLIAGNFPTSQTPQDNPYLAVRSLSRRSTRLTEQITAAKVRLKDELVQAGLGLLHVFRGTAIFNKAPMELMKRYPLPEDRLAAGVEEIAQLLASHSRNKYGRTEAEKLRDLDLKNQPDKRLRSYFRQSITDYIEEIEYFQAKQKQYQEKIDAETKDLPSAQNLLSLIGCGPKLMPIVLSETGDISRFASADKYVGYAGLAPVEHESGPYKGEKHLKKGGSPRLSYACYLIANCARRKDERLKNLYQRVKVRHQKAGKPPGIAHQIANCAVAREVARLIYSILSENRKYFSNPADYRAFRAAKLAAA